MKREKGVKNSPYFYYLNFVFLGLCVAFQQPRERFVRLANVYDCCALAVCICWPVITLISLCKDVPEIL